MCIKIMPYNVTMLKKEYLNKIGEKFIWNFSMHGK